MNVRRALITLSTLALCQNAYSDIIIDDNLIEQMKVAGQNGTVSALIHLDSGVDIKLLSDSISQQGLRFHERHQIVVETLQNEANISQSSVLQTIEKLKLTSNIERVDAFWISNVIRIDASPSVIHTLSTHKDVSHIYLNYPIELVEPVSSGPVGQDRNIGGVEAGIDAVRAPEVWEMGFDGDGVLVATLDTGVQGSHEALASRWAGLRPEYAGHPEWAFLDPFTGDNSFPFDSGSHGTHTMGTVCGGAPGLGIGVAPGAHWITSAAIDRYTIPQTVADAITSFQWFADPDGNPQTSWDVPRVCSNSWGLTTGHGYPNCDQTFWTYLDNLEAVGCVVLFSAGNEGSSGLRRPGDRATDDYRTCAVAAIDPYDSNWGIASFSSRGPTYCTPDGSSAIKPDIAAPGVDTYSSVPGGYSSYSGTSMASPHVNGAVALMFQANPDLDVDMVKQILYETAVDLGAAGEDNDYGAGMIDCVEAVTMALGSVSLTWSYPNGRPERLDPNGGDEIDILISGSQATPNPSTAMMHIVEGGGTLEVPLVHDGGPNFRAIFPQLTCGDTIDYYFTIETTEGELSSSPYSAPGSTWSAVVWAGYESTVMVEDFVDGIPNGWTATGLWSVSTSCLPSGDCGDGAAAYFGITSSCNYDDGSTVTGSLSTPVIPLEDGISNLMLSFCSAIETEDLGGYDDTDLYINGTYFASLPESTNWQQVEFDLSNFAGSSIQIEWRFDSVDSLYNDYRGWHIDDVQLSAEFLDCSNVCAEDIDGDGDVNVTDLLAIIDQWGASGSPADVTGDGVVDVSDLLAVVGNWGPCG